MVIDTHTHIFPDKIADAAVKSLEANLPEGRYAFTNGKLDGLIDSMGRAGIDYSVVLPVVTSPKQFDSINRFAASIHGKNGILSFGGIHPDNIYIEEKLSYIKSLGLPGIKLHLDYQNCYVDDPRVIRIIKACVKLDLMVVIHAGVDVGYPEPVHCPPDRAAKMLDAVYDGKTPSKPHIILAHLGGHEMYDDVLRYLAGKNIYFDLAYSADKLPMETLLTIIRCHGADRILFATDSPWEDQSAYLKFIKALPLPDDDIEKILWKNAADFLPLSLS